MLQYMRKFEMIIITSLMVMMAIVVLLACDRISLAYFKRYYYSSYSKTQN